MGQAYQRRATRNTTNQQANSRPNDHQQTTQQQSGRSSAPRRRNETTPRAPAIASPNTSPAAQTGGTQGQNPSQDSGPTVNTHPATTHADNGASNSSRMSSNPSIQLTVHSDATNPAPIPIDPTLLEHPVFANIPPPPGIHPAPATIASLYPPGTANSFSVTNSSTPATNPTTTLVGGPMQQAGTTHLRDETIALLLNQVRRLEEQLAGGGSSSGGSVPSASTSTPRASGSQTTIPKPKGSAGGGRRGFHLQDEMGLADDDEGQRRYNMILATVRELAHAARLDLSCPYRRVTPENLNKIFSSARKLHPYLTRFENDWATAEILKQYLSSARRYGRRKGYFDCAGEARRRRGRNLDDMFDGDGDNGPASQ
ncbi:hypothetical protein BC629DRAFT_519160 [Irpex lacteus]|nr:hypothetical protein BC629DRAFT_519160 [Irpex lacteus]